MATEVKAQLSLDQSQFAAGLNKATANLNAFATGQISAVKGQLAAAFTVGAITTLVSDVVKLGSHFNDLSIRTGISSEELQKLGFAAKLNGATIDDVVGAFQKLSINMAAAKEKGGEAREAFARLGVSLSDLQTNSCSSKKSATARE